MAAEIYVVRHGETEWSLSGQHTSRTDLPLTADGRSRASALAPLLAGRTFSLVLCSPMLRARETCALAGLGDEAIEDDDLREWGYGEYEGLTTPEILASRPDWDLWRDGCPGGEQPADVGARADRVLARLEAADGDTAIAFAHGHILRVVVARWIALPPAGGARFLLGAGSFGVLGYERSRAAVAGWNQSPP
jgi:broad specificity phosphatase PhoE